MGNIIFSAFKNVGNVRSGEVSCSFHSFDFILIFPIPKVIAEDIDGPSHNHVRYAIVDGNQGSPFTIDAARGELRVARQLDRERVRTPADTTLACTNAV